MATEEEKESLITLARQLAKKYDICEINRSVMIIDIRQGRLRTTDEVERKALRLKRK